MIGEAGDYGNAFTVEASLSPDRSDPAPGVALFSYQPTVRWREGSDPTEVRFDAPAGAALRLQSFDGAEGEIALVSTFDERRLPASGQDEWRVAPFDGAGRPRGDHHPRRQRRPRTTSRSALFDADGRAGGARDAAAPGAARRRARRRSPRRGRWRTAPRSPSTPRPRPATARSPIAGASATAARATRRSSPMPSPRRAATRPSSRCSAAATQIGRGARVAVPVHVRAAPVAVAGDPVTAAPGEPVAFDGAASVPSDSPITRFHWSFGDGAEAEGVATTHAYERPGVYRADAAGRGRLRTIPAPSASPPGS